ncbi:hypothetical protein [Thiocystis violacea]|uniref:hypothetical protein n=1 Tax=Thiocystis violacea TaxID=13725 RepID=UPI001907351D|nr:hypothetical protein [Thiocystis violacea]MBK1717291.1 hypothetical protein [Thiocystis violacea]
MSIRLNDSELSRLTGQIADIWQFYLVLRKFMDYRTGLVGIMRGISWQSLQEEMYVEPGQGLEKTGTPAKSKLRRLAQRMEKAGLVSNRAQPKKLIFFMCLATRDDSANNKPGTNPAQTRQTHPDSSEASHGVAEPPLNDRTRHLRFSKGSAKPDTPPVSGIRKEKEVLTHLSIGDRPGAVVPDVAISDPDPVTARPATPNPPIPELGRQPNVDLSLLPTPCPDLVQHIFTHWQQAMNKPRAKLDTKRRAAIAARLKDGYSVEDLLSAVDGCKGSAWHQGQNDRHRPFNDLSLICRDGAHVEQFLDLATGQRQADTELEAFLKGGQSDTLEGEFHVVR